MKQKIGTLLELAVFVGALATIPLTILQEQELAGACAFGALGPTAAVATTDGRNGSGSQRVAARLERIERILLEQRNSEDEPEVAATRPVGRDES